MKEFAAELVASIAEAMEQVDKARAEDDPYGVEVWAERVKVLRRLAQRNGIDLAGLPGAGRFPEADQLAD